MRRRATRQEPRGKSLRRLSAIEHVPTEQLLGNRATGRRLLTDQEVRVSYDIPCQSELIYTDGSCFGHNTRSPKAGIGVYFGRNDFRNISARLPGPIQTSSRAELFAVLKALESLYFNAMSSGGKFVYILSDSKTVVDVLNRHYPSWTQAKISSKDGFQRVRDMVTVLEDNGIAVNFKHVRGHSGILGNEAADILAKKGAMKLPESNVDNFDSESFNLMFEEVWAAGSGELDVFAAGTLGGENSNYDDEVETTILDDSDCDVEGGDAWDNISEELYEDEELDKMIREELLYEDEVLDLMIAGMDDESVFGRAV